MPLAGGLAGDLPLLPGKEGPHVETGPLLVMPSLQGGQAVHVDAVIIHLEDIVGLALLSCHV